MAYNEEAISLSIQGMSRRQIDKAMLRLQNLRQVQTMHLDGNRIHLLLNLGNLEGKPRQNAIQVAKSRASQVVASIKQATRPLQAVRR